LVLNLFTYTNSNSERSEIEILFSVQIWTGGSIYFRSLYNSDNNVVSIELEISGTSFLSRGHYRANTN